MAGRDDYYGGGRGGGGYGGGGGGGGYGGGGPGASCINKRPLVMFTKIDSNCAVIIGYDASLASLHPQDLMTLLGPQKLLRVMGTYKNTLYGYESI
ncbi:unnamed protein product [Strongylus vulgaris]|uniref:Uncharacterized protein n=1 Tax=Strongylus vulgaris TaxID=40348 RepID=A0A3P7KI85_STRVU|nr:unnamed protein product [Strongylus vulgaris]